MNVNNDLHPAFGEPAIEAMNFLNEIMKRHPQAISFAPGAPNLNFLAEFNSERLINIYLEHIQNTQHRSRMEASSLLYEYGPAQGLICDLVADALRRDQGPNVCPDDILITVGAQEAIFLALRALFRTPQDHLAIVTPCYVGVRGASSLLGIEAVSIPEEADGVDLNALSDRLSEARKFGKNIRAIYLSPDYSNPAGTVMSLSKRKHLLTLAEREDFYILEDGAYGFTAAFADTLPSLKSLDQTRRVIYIGTFAKICLPGARVGFAVADQVIRDARGGKRSLAQAMASAKSMITVNTSPICQAIIGGMLIENGFSLVQLGKSKGELYRRNMACLISALDRELDSNTITWNRPLGGFFIIMDISVPANAELLEYCARSFDVLWTPMSQFYLDNSGKCQIRLSCSYLSPAQIDTGVERLSKFLHSLPNRSHSPSSGIHIGEASTIRV